MEKLKHALLYDFGYSTTLSNFFYDVEYSKINAIYKFLEGVLYILIMLIITNYSVEPYILIANNKITKQDHTRMHICICQSAHMRA